MSIGKGNQQRHGSTSIRIDTVVLGLQSRSYAAGEVWEPRHMIVSHSKPIVANPPYHWHQREVQNAQIAKTM